MISLPLMKQTFKSNAVIWLAMTGVSAILLGQFAAMEMTQNLLFTIYYSIMVTLFPAIYSMICANKLLASQVDSGSMAYVLASPKRRSNVVLTQVAFSIGTMALMFLVTAIVHSLVNASSPLSILQATGGSIKVGGNLTTSLIMKVSLSAFAASIAVSGLCFMFSGIFNRSKYAIGFSGALIGVCILAGMMAMFGTLGMSELENFKYLTLFSLFDYHSILIGGSEWMTKALSAGLIGLVGYTIGGVWFCRKDLPL